MKKLGFGCMRLPLLDADDPTSIDFEQVCSMVDRFLERGFTYFDTAYFYHKGESERLVKRALVERHPRDSFLLATKLPLSMLKDKTQEDMVDVFNEQMEKTGVTYFDYYLLHCINEGNYETAQRLGSFEFIQHMKAEGKIRHCGFSFHDSPALLDKVLTEHPEVEFVQLQINYLDWENPTVQSGELYDIAVRHGKKVVVMEPVKGGKLAAPQQEVMDLLTARDAKASPASWAIRFAATLDSVMMVLSGMSNMEQLTDNTDYMMDFQPLTAEEQDMLFEAANIIRGDGTVPCTGCSYCTEGCPMKIQIPTIFTLHNGNIRTPEEQDYKAAYKALEVNGDFCKFCGQCMRACPQHIDVIGGLQLAHALLSK